MKPGLDEILGQARGDLKAHAERFASLLTTEQLEEVFKDVSDELVKHQFADLLPYIDAIRAEYRKRSAK